MNQLTLPTARARNSDPETSKAAAASIGKGVEEAVLRVHRRQSVWWTDGLTDDELCDLLPAFLRETVKSARSRLKNDGRLRDSGRTRPSNRGRAQVVWILNEEGA